MKIFDSNLVKVIFLLLAVIALLTPAIGANAFSKSTKKKIIQYAVEGKPGVNHKSSKNPAKKARKINTKVIKKVFIRKPGTKVVKLKEVTDKKKVKEINTTVIEAEEASPATTTLRSILPRNKSKPIEISSKESDVDLKIQKNEKKTNSRYIYKSGKIKSSLVNLASKQAIPNSVIAKAIRVLSSRNNLSVDVRKGDLFEILYEEIRNDSGKLINPGHILYISLKGKIINSEAFSYSSTGKRSKENFYDIKGRGFKKSILRKPLKGRYRISSGFGYRRHPVLKRRILHSGTDFAAPRGTPVYAGADGTIAKIGRFGGYGNYIKIEHDSKWQTAYGHMKKFAKGMRKWKRVKQGQLIGYVGTTGRSTGPHLHYEILKYGKAVDSQKVSLPIGIQLNRNSVIKLNKRIIEIRSLLKRYKRS